MKDTLSLQLERVSRAVIHRINFPKVLAGKMGRIASLRAKSRPLLSEHDQQEVAQTVSLVLCATGTVQRMAEPLATAQGPRGLVVSFADWKACFRAVRSKGCLRIETGHCKADATDIATLHEASEADAIGCAVGRFFRVDRAQEIRRQVIARRVRYLRACINARFATDPSRQRKHNRAKALRFLRYLASQYSAGMGEVEILDADTPEAAYMARNRFEKYVAAGEAALDASEDARTMAANLDALTMPGALQRL